MHQTSGEGFSQSSRATDESEVTVSKQLFKPLDINNNQNKNGVSSRRQHQETYRNGKVGANLDKWLKDLKGHVLSEFERSRGQLVQEQHKKLNEEKEK